MMARLFDVSTLTGLSLTLLDNLFKLITDEPDELDEEDIIIKILVLKSRKIPQVVCESIQQDNFCNKEFRKHFRMDKETFNYLLNKIEKSLRHVGFGRPPIKPELQFLITLWFFANCDSYREISLKFNMSLATTVRCIRRVEVIHWPENPLNNCEGFEELYHFPRVAGAIDGTHINIPLYKAGQHYINRKSNASIQLQVVTDHTLKFIHVYAGQVGSVHDARVLRLSGVQDICNDDSFFPENSHLIGDAAYPIQKHLLVPYKNNGHLSPEQVNFNKQLSAARLVVERFIGLLKIRWRKLLNKLPMIRVDLVPLFIVACCILHNICILKNDLYHCRYERRHNVRVRQNNIVSVASKNAGLAKRNAISHELYIA